MAFWLIDVRESWLVPCSGQPGDIYFIGWSFTFHRWPCLERETVYLGWLNLPFTFTFCDCLPCMGSWSSKLQGFFYFAPVILYFARLIFYLACVIFYFARVISYLAWVILAAGSASKSPLKIKSSGLINFGKKFINTINTGRTTAVQTELQHLKFSIIFQYFLSSEVKTLYNFKKRCSLRVWKVSLSMGKV